MRGKILIINTVISRFYFIWLLLSYPTRNSLGNLKLSSFLFVRRRPKRDFQAWDHRALKRERRLKVSHISIIELVCFIFRCDGLIYQQELSFGFIKLTSCTQIILSNKEKNSLNNSNAIIKRGHRHKLCRLPFGY